MTVKVGQFWEDCDKRIQGRRLCVVEVGDTYAWLVPVDAHGQPMKRAKTTRLLLRRMHPTSSGFRLVTND